MKRFTIMTVVCAVMLISTIFVDGCTSSATAPALDTGAVPQYTHSIEPTHSVSGIPTQNQETLAESAGNPEDAATVNDDTLVDPYNSTGQATTMVPDSGDLGDPVP